MAKSRVENPAALLRQVDAQIRRGNGELASETLQGVTPSQLPRSLHAQFAGIARRLGKPEIGLRLLSKPIHVARQLREKVAPSEVAEYAACLIYSGLSAEGGFLLDTISANDYPAALLYRGFAYVSEWKYAESIPFFREYSKLKSLTAYQRAVAQVNLAAALIYERRFLPAENLLRELLHETSHRRLGLLHGIVLEFYSLCLLSRRKFSEARTFLDRAMKSLSRTPGLDAFFARKWMALVSLFESPDDERSLLGVDAIRAEAKTIGHWETRRDCDRYQAIATRDSELAVQTYLGTPFSTFREKLVRDFPGGLRLPSDLRLRMGEGPVTATLDLRRGGARARLGTGELKAGGLAFRVVMTLASDSYRPFSPGRLFQAVFPGERYLGSPSVHRIQVAVTRCRELLSGGSLGIDIESVGGSYRLKSREGCLEILCDRELPTGTATRSEFLRFELERAFGETPFSISQAEEVVTLPRRSLVRELTQAYQAGLLERTGKLAATRYRVRPKKAEPG